MCTIPIRAPSTSTTRSSGSAFFSAGSSMFPCTASTGGPSSRNDERNAAETKSPRVQDQIRGATELDATLG